MKKVRVPAPAVPPRGVRKRAPLQAVLSKAPSAPVKMDEVPSAKPSVLLNPWFLLALFTLTHAVLAHFPMGFLPRLSLIAAGILLPFALPLSRLFRGGSSRAVPRSFEPGPVLWVLFAAWFAVSYLYRLGSLPPWMGPDQVNQALNALQLRDHWTWKLHFGGDQVEPLYIWLLALYLKAVPVGQYTVRLFPVLLAAAATAVTYWGARGFLGRSASWAAAWLTGLGFLPFIAVRVGHRSVLVLIFVSWALGILGRHRRLLSRRERFFSALHLGLAAGLGLYAYTSWIAVIAWLFLSVLWLDVLRKRRCVPALLGFLLVLLAVATPLLEAWKNASGDPYAATLFKPDILNGMKAYLIGFFWDGFKSAPFGPVWGGSLNFLAAGLACTGAALWLARTSRAKALWFLSLVLLFLLPGALTRYVQMYRVLHLIPVIAVGAAFALVRLADPFPKRFRPVVVLVLLAASSVLDAWHFLGPFQDPSRYQEEYHSYFNPQPAKVVGFLKDWRRKNGPLCVLEQFNMRDAASYVVPLYPLDASRERSAGSAPVSWVAILANIHYDTYLSREFEGSAWLWAGEGTRASSGGLGVGIFPYGPETKERLDRWIEANRVLRSVGDTLSNLGWGGDPEPYLAELRAEYPRFRGDRFLESIYFNKKASVLGFNQRYTEAVQDLRRGLILGYSAPHVYFDLGVVQELAGNLKGAETAYFYAGEQINDRTVSRERLDSIRRNREQTP